MPSESFTCPRCKAVTRDLALARRGYCSTCREFTGLCGAASLAVALLATGVVTMPGWHGMLAVDRRRRHGDRRPALRVTRGSPATRSHIVDGEPGPEAGVRGHPPILCGRVTNHPGCPELGQLVHTLGTTSVA